MGEMTSALGCDSPREDVEVSPGEFRAQGMRTHKEQVSSEFDHNQYQYAKQRVLCHLTSCYVNTDVSAYKTTLLGKLSSFPW